MSLKKGDKAPKFNLPTNTGEQVSLEQCFGKKVVLFFYPKDDTPGCTKESCDFRDLQTAFANKNALVFGISADDVDSHKAFAAKYNLNFPLLADVDHQVCEAYGVWGEQEWQGKKFQGIGRSTFVIDEAGNISAAYSKVNPTGHATEVLESLS